MPEQPQTQGLVTQAQTPQAAPEQVPQEGAPEGAAPTPEEEAAYASALDMAGELVYVNDTSSAKFVAMLSAKPAVESVPPIVAHIMDKIEEAFNGELPQEVILPAADEITDMLLEVGVESGAFPAPSEQEADDVRTAMVTAIMQLYEVEEEAVAETAQAQQPGAIV